MQRRSPAGDHSLHKVRRRAKGGGNFARVQNADASAAPRADVKQAAAVPERFSHSFNGFCEIRSCSTQRIFNEFLFLDKKFGQLSHAHFFQVLGTWVALFGKGGSQIFDFFFRKLWLKRKRSARLCGKPRSAKFGRSL